MKLLCAKSSISNLHYPKGMTLEDLTKRVKTELSQKLAVAILEEKIDNVTVKYLHSEETPWVPIDRTEYEVRVALLSEGEYNEYLILRKVFTEEMGGKLE